MAGGDRTFGARRVRRDALEKGLSCGLHRIERLMRQGGMRARPKRRGSPKDGGERSVIADDILEREFAAERPNQKRLADLTMSGPPRAGSKSPWSWIRSRAEGSAGR